jgi:O-antigen/teichoic acid export membrane protein
MAFLKVLTGFACINMLRALIPFALLPILTRALTPREYGVLSIFESSILVLTPLMLFNAQGFLASRYYKIAKVQLAELNLNVFVLAVITFAGTQSVFFLFSDFLLRSFGLPDKFFLFIPAFVLSRLINNYVSCVWQIQHNVKTYGFFSVGTLLCDLLLSIFLVVLLGLGYKGRLAGSHIALLIFSLIGLSLLAKGGLLGGRVSSERIREIIRFGGPLIPHALGGVSLAMANRYLLASELNSDAVGIFAVAYQVASVMLLVGTSINQAWSVSLFRLLGNGISENQSPIRRLMGAMFALMVGAYAVLYWLQDFLFGLLAGSGFEASKRYFPYLLLSFFFQSVYFLFVNFDFYEERVKSIGVTTFVIALINIAMNLMLIPYFGILGSVFATLASMGLYVSVVVVRVVMFNASFRLVWLS